MADVHVVALTRADVDAVVTIHARAFPDSAITAFGPDAIRRYYLWLLEGPHDAELTGAWLGSELVGFCAAGVFRGAMNGFLRSNRRFLALHIVTHPWLALSPLIRDRVRTALKITFRYRQSRTRREPPAAVPSFGVLSIATNPDVRGSGAGRALMLDAESRARAAGHRRMTLTVHPENARAVKFYEQLGWTRASDADEWSGAMDRVLG